MNTKINVSNGVKPPHTGKIVWFYPNENYENMGSDFNLFPKSGRSFHCAIVIDGEDTYPNLEVKTNEGSFILKSIPHESDFQNSFVGYWDYINYGDVKKMSNRHKEVIDTIVGAYYAVALKMGIVENSSMSYNDNIMFEHLPIGSRYWNWSNPMPISFFYNKNSKEIAFWVISEFENIGLWKQNSGN